MTLDGPHGAKGEAPADDPALYVFVPEADAAICADCHGYFRSQLGHCPGCGSKHYTLATDLKPRKRKQRSVK